MIPSNERLARIAKAARARVASQTAKTQRSEVAKALRERKPAEAEPDADRRLRRVQAVADVDEAKARKLLRGTSPRSLLSGDELFGAERLIGNTVDFVPVSFLNTGQVAATAVARVIQRSGSPVGSGFLISGRLFITNNHVIGSEDEAGRMLLEFDYETDAHSQPRPTTRFALDPSRFFVTNDRDDLDFTVVAVGERVTGSKELVAFACCPLSDSNNKHMLGEYVNIIQHPEGDFKQLVLRENKLVTRLDTVLHYEADTQPGSSGSPVFNDEWEAVALHHWGGPHREQKKSDGEPVPSTVNEGIRVSAIVAALRTERAKPGRSPEWQRLLDDALSAVDHPQPRASDDAVAGEKSGQVVPRPIAGGVHGASVGGTRVNSDGSVTLTLEVNVRLAGAFAAGPVAGEEKIKPDPEYTTRQGYAPSFLAGFNLPIPKVTAQAPGVKAKLLHPSPGDDPFELKYEHFTIVVNKTRKLPFVTAANIDGKRSIKVDRKTGKAVHGAGGGDGDGESAEATETWYVDPRIAAGDQTSQPLYDHQSPRVFDRGHQVRREDPCWGTDSAAERANADTFHFTNCCPQEYRFNEQVRFWAGIENYVLDNARSEEARVSVYTGPVFAATDPPYRGIRVPLQFFKVIARVEDGELKATAFLANQAELLSTLPERLAGAEGFDDLGSVRSYATTIADIEEMTGLDFGVLRDHDTFAPEALGARRPLLSEQDLRAALGGQPSGAAAPARALAPRAAAEAAATFSAASLSATSFDWQTTLSAALACELAYQDGPAVKNVALQEWGLQTCEFLSINDTQCFVASSSDTALVAFRGTQELADWLTNLNTAYTNQSIGKVHRGFWFAMMDVHDELHQMLSGLGKARVVVTGHSLGGAIATLFAAEAPTSVPIEWVFTFGQPRCGIGNKYTSSVNDRFAKRCVRVVNNNDVVPRVPPWPFAHVGRLVQFDAGGTVSGDPESLTTHPAAARTLTPREAANFPPALSDAEFERLKRQLRTSRMAVGAEGLFPSVADHAIAKYIAQIAAQLT